MNNINTPLQKYPERASVDHPLWEHYVAWDKRRHHGSPSLEDTHDREEFEAFIYGANLCDREGRNKTENIPDGEPKTGGQLI